MHYRHHFIYAPLEISIENTDKDWTMPDAHAHSDYEIYVLLSGTRHVWIKDIIYETNCGDAALFRSNIPHKSSRNTSYSGICIHFSRHLLEEYFTPKAINLLLSCFHKPVITLSKKSICQLQTHAATFSTANPMNYLILADILRCCCEDSTHTSPSSPTVKKPSSDSVRKTAYANVLNYILENYTAISDLSAVAMKFDISESYLYKIVKKETGLTPKSYINELRMRNVLRDITSKNHYTMKNIALRSGYTSYEYFCRLFKEKYGISPTAYRALHS